MQYSSLMCPMIAAQFLVPVQACCDNIAKDSFCYVHQAFMPQGRYYWSIEMSHALHQNGISQAMNQSIVIILSQCFDQCGSIFRKGSVCKQYVPLMNVNDFNYKLHWLLKINADIRKRGEKYRAWNPTIHSIIKWTPLQLRKAACHMYLWNYVTNINAIVFSNKKTALKIVQFELKLARACFGSYRLSSQEITQGHSLDLLFYFLTIYIYLCVGAYNAGDRSRGFVFRHFILTVISLSFSTLHYHVIGIWLK